MRCFLINKDTYNRTRFTIEILTDYFLVIQVLCEIMHHYMFNCQFSPPHVTSKREFLLINNTIIVAGPQLRWPHSQYQWWHNTQEADTVCVFTAIAHFIYISCFEIYMCAILMFCMQWTLVVTRFFVGP